jgi:hypothetical protein
MVARWSWHVALAAYAVLNGMLYACLMPLWEGFDEPFHYAYVQRLATRGGLPISGKTPLSAELWQSLHLAPGSYLVKRNLPFVMTYSEYFALPPADRESLRNRLDTLDTALRHDDVPGTSNYEAQQPPLAYAVLAVTDRLWADVPLPARILRLRLLCAVSAGLLVAFLTLWLAELLGLPAPARYGAAFVVLSSQMLYACVARVANEWLAIPAVVLVLIATVRFQRRPDNSAAVLAGAAMAVALLAKSYSLSWVVFAACVMLYVAWRPALVALGIAAVAAGPWYWRNMRLYGDLSGIMLAKKVGFADALRQLPSIPWPKVAIASARGALWTGNNSFTSFSAGTLHLVLLLMLVAGVMWLRSPRKKEERLVAAGCLSYVPALIYYCCMIAAYGGEPSITVAPWYLQVLSPPVACLLFLGCARSGRWGRILAGALVLLATYMICATYVLKLIPLYSGYPAASVRLRDLWRWYTHDPARQDLLTATALASPAVWLLTSAVVVMAVGLCVCLIFISIHRRASAANP